MVLVCSFDGRSDVDVCVLIGRFIGFEFLTTHLRLQRSQFWLRIEMKHISSTGKEQSPSEMNHKPSTKKEECPNDTINYFAF
ncbi:hypothetical protein HanRHA438_Chr11g0481151 [Helianthus annuus]|nr:hypothetical protein HanIR_Chr11g0503631 [Helianthus annuus]KAJ0868699.1 hypothetical protein HanRHA438_Chr11g0481151 [Helianthus annuus]